MGGGLDVKTPEEIAAEARRRYFATVGAPVDTKIDAMILDGTDDAADWLQIGYTLDRSDVEWLRGLEIVR